jgi:hypothetical protein
VKISTFKKINNIISVKAAKLLGFIAHLDTSVELGAYFGQEKTIETTVNLNPELARTMGGYLRTDQNADN